MGVAGHSHAPTSPSACSSTVICHNLLCHGRGICRSVVIPGSNQLRRMYSALRTERIRADKLRDKRKTIHSDLTSLWTPGSICKWHGSTHNRACTGQYPYFSGQLQIWEALIARSCAANALFSPTTFVRLWRFAIFQFNFVHNLLWNRLPHFRRGQPSARPRSSAHTEISRFAVVWAVCSGMRFGHELQVDVTVTQSTRLRMNLDRGTNASPPRVSSRSLSHHLVRLPTGARARPCLPVMS